QQLASDLCFAHAPGPARSGRVDRNVRGNVWSVRAVRLSLRHSGAAFPARTRGAPPAAASAGDVDDGVVSLSCRTTPGRRRTTAVRLQWVVVGQGDGTVGGVARSQARSGQSCHLGRLRGLTGGSRRSRKQLDQLARSNRRVPLIAD